jgi:uncharacterized membrane protein
MIIPEEDKSRISKTVVTFFVIAFGSILVIVRYGRKYAGISDIAWICFILAATLLIVIAIFWAGRKLSWDWSRWD